MAIETFPWDTIGYPTDIKVRDKANVLSSKFHGAYRQTRGKNTRKIKLFETIWDSMTAGQWLALIAFFRTMGGGAEAFYWQYPVEIGYGYPGYGQPNVEESAAGFDTIIEVGYGESPIFLVRFAEETEEELKQEYVPLNRWKVAATFEQV